MRVKFLIYVLLISSLTGFASDLKSQKKPNILFILVDDLGKEWVSAYGAEDIETPQIDALAQNGMMFSNSFCMPQCTPTRITLMTGQYPYRHGWINHWDVPRWGGGCHYDPAKNPGLARLMKAAGYKTAVAGKWQVNDFRVQPDAMVEHGFDEYCMWTGYEADNPPSSKRYWNPYIHTKKGSRTYDAKFGEDLFTNFLIDFMKENKDKPMFMYYPMCLTHTPFTTTPDEPNVAEPIEKHKAMVRYTDNVLGRLTQALEDLEIRDNTIIIWTTDNGTSGKITGTLNGRKIKGGKGNTTENGICIPFIVNGPGLVPQGVKTDALCDFTDILPTCAEIAGIDLPNEYIFDGHSIANLILGKSNESAREWILGMGGGNYAKRTDRGIENMYVFRDRVIRNKRFKLFVDTKRRPVKLVDLTTDPDEKINLINSRDPKVLEALNKLKAVLPRLPEKDNDPIYIPLPPEDWDVKITAKSQVWKQ